MPFKSEKQRRFLWAARPDIAKRWAHEYPESNKGLPMYADKKDKASDSEKAAALRALSLATARFSGDGRVLTSATNAANFAKTGMDSILRVDIPHSDKPTYAGQERAEGEQKLEENENETSERAPRDKCDQQGAQALLAKLSAVLARPYRAEMENEQALSEGREPRFVPQNMGLKRYSVPSPYITPPMGMGAPPPNASAAQGAQAAQQNMPQPSNSPVGGGSNPQHNPIQAFGPLGAKGQLNGNAAFGQKNSPDSLKSAGLKDIFGKGEKLPGWYGAESLIEIPGGGYRYGHTHSVDVVDSKPGWLRRIFDRDPYVMREDVPKYKRKLKAIRGMHVMEQPNRLEFSHMGQLKPEMRQLIEAALAKQAGASPAWQRSEGKNPEGGLNEKGRKSYERETGGDLKAPVTESNPSGERAKRQSSFCSRMCGMKRVNTGASTAKDPDSRINKSLRKWNCKCGSARDLLTIAQLGSEKEAFLGDLYRRATDPVRKKVNDAIRKAVLAAGISGAAIGGVTGGLAGSANAPAAPAAQPAAVQMAEQAAQAVKQKQQPLRLAAKDINAPAAVRTPTSQPVTPAVIHAPGPVYHGAPALRAQPGVPGTPEIKAAPEAVKKHVAEMVKAKDLKAALPGAAPSGPVTLPGNQSAGLGIAAALTGIGSGLGAYQAPKGHKTEGATRGGIRGAATGLGGLGGAALARLATAHPMARLGGGLVGAGLGYGGAGLALGKPSWQNEKSANFITDLTRNLGSRAGMMTGIFGRKAAPALPSRAASAAQAAAKKVLSMSTAHPSVLPALAAARREAVPSARLSELAQFMWNRTPRPVAPPTTRLRMPDGIHMFRRFGDTEAAHAALSNAMQRYTRVGQAAGRIPPLHSTGEFVSFFGDVPTTAKTWGQLQGIVPKRAR